MSFILLIDSLVHYLYKQLLFGFLLIVEYLNCCIWFLFLFYGNFNMNKKNYKTLILLYNTYLLLSMSSDESYDPEDDREKKIDKSQKRAKRK